MGTLSPANVEHALRYVVDPEMGISVVDLGLIYGITVGPAGEVDVTMTLTTPNCPMGQVLPEACRRMVTNMTGATAVTVHLAWEPAWSPERISESGRQQLGMPAS